MSDQPRHTPEQLASANAGVPERGARAIELTKNAIKIEERFLDLPVVNAESTEATWEAIKKPEQEQIEAWKKDMEKLEKARNVVLAWRANAIRYPPPFNLTVEFRLFVPGSPSANFEAAYAPATTPVKGLFEMKGDSSQPIQERITELTKWPFEHLAFVNYGRAHIVIKLDDHLIAGYQLPRVPTKQLPEKLDHVEFDFAADVDANRAPKTDGHVIILFIHERPQHPNELAADEDIEVIEEEEKKDDVIEAEVVKVAEDAKAEGMEWKTPDKWEVKKITAELRTIADTARELQALMRKHNPPLGPGQKEQWEREMVELERRMQTLLGKGSRIESYITHAGGAAPVEFGEVMTQLLLILGMFEHILVDRFEFIRNTLRVDVEFGSPEAKKKAQESLDEIVKVRKKYKAAIDRIATIFPELKERLPVDLPDRKVATGEEPPTAPVEDPLAPKVVTVDTPPESSPKTIGFKTNPDAQARGPTRMSSTHDPVTGITPRRKGDTRTW